MNNHKAHLKFHNFQKFFLDIQIIKNKWLVHKTSYKIIKVSFILPEDLYISKYFIAIDHKAYNKMKVMVPFQRWIVVCFMSSIPHGSSIDHFLLQLAYQLPFY
jgi:hypothetical protein